MPPSTTDMNSPRALTLAAFARLPKDVAAALLAPLDPASIRVEDCLSDDEVERVIAGAGFDSF
jgi:hypothetical protein